MRYELARGSDSEVQNAWSRRRKQMAASGFVAS